MTAVELLDPSPTSILEEIKRQLELSKVTKTVEITHGRLKLDDLDKISKRTPAAFIAMSRLRPNKRPNGDVIGRAELAIMVAHRATDNGWQLQVDLFELINGSVWRTRTMSEPKNVAFIPIFDPNQSKNKIGLTAITWEQSFKLTEAKKRNQNPVAFYDDKDNLIAPLDAQSDE